MKPPATPKPRQRPLDALAKSRPGEIGTLAPGVSQKRLGVARRQPGERAVERRGELVRDRQLFRRRRPVRAVRHLSGGQLAPTARPRPVRPDLPPCNAQGPGQGVAPRVELAGPREDPEQRLLGGVLRFGRGQTTCRETSKEGPESPEKRVERGPVPSRERGHFLLERGAAAGIHPFPALSRPSGIAIASTLRPSPRTPPRSCFNQG